MLQDFLFGAALSGALWSVFYFLTKRRHRGEITRLSTYIGLLDKENWRIKLKK